MLSKDSLRKEFAKDYKEHYSVEIFEKEGFTRQTCKCGKSYWSVGKSDCGDSFHSPYSFFKPDNKNKETYASFWKRYASFWKKNKHEVITRYPVVSRWRPDLYFTMASIQDFQRIEKGKMVFEYPANPLIVPQISLRFNDIANVGVTGRHFSCFMMAGQHAFNYPKEGYWKDECIRLNFEFLTKVLGIKKQEITYTEDVWAMGDFSAFGPCIESFANGLELVNSVFMQYSTINNKRRELDTKVIDVGWGFERLLWYANGDYTAYDSVFPREIKHMEQRAGIKVDRDLFQRYASMASKLDADEGSVISEEEKKIAKELGRSIVDLKKSIFPLQAIYAIVDHSRSLLFAISDGSLPSNVGGGYNLRVILRRAFSFMEEYDFDFDISEIMDMVAEDLKPVFPELQESLPSVHKIIDVEKGRYSETKVKATRIVSELILRKEKLSNKKMMQLYESHGITPELISKVASDHRQEIDVPTNFYSTVTKKSFNEKKGTTDVDTTGLPSTEPLYYKLESRSKSKVLKTDGKRVILDRTVFYPEGGGQATDLGKINNMEVIRADKIGEIVVHTLRGKPGFKKGDIVDCVIDTERRNNLMRHHTATHLVNAACRKILGNHIWQAGAKKEPDQAHLDVTHYEKIDQAKLNEIEALANRYIRECHPVNKPVMERGDAEKKYGFTLYQGGASPGKVLRIIDVDGLDVEACGGLHVNNTGEIGVIKIIRESRVQDGISRIEFKAGAPAILYIQKQNEILLKSSDELHIQPEYLPKTINKFFSGWKERGKRIEGLEHAVAEVRLKQILSSKEEVVHALMEADQKTLSSIANELIKKGKAGVIVGQNNTILCVGNKKHDAKSLLKKMIKEYGGNGGGDERIARGKLAKRPNPPS